MLVIPAPTEGEPNSEVDEVAWRRELKQLRVRVGQLESERKTLLDPAINTSRDGKHGYRCGHPCGVIVYDNEPLIECRVCGAKLDPVDVLREFARHERNFCYTLEHLRKERGDLHEEIKKLKSLRSRLRADARELLPDPPVRAGTGKWMRGLIANEQLDRVLAKEPCEP